jgi:hypothetical protein
LGYVWRAAGYSNKLHRHVFGEGNLGTDSDAIHHEVDCLWSLLLCVGRLGSIASKPSSKRATGGQQSERLQTHHHQARAVTILGVISK